MVDIVSSNYFSVLGVSPAYGRAFLPEEEKPGAGRRVAVVSHAYWQKNRAILRSSGVHSH